MTKQNTKKYIRIRIQENTESNLKKVLELLSEITNEEHFYNHQLSDFTHETRLTVVEILKECYKEENKFKSIFENTK